MNRAAAAAAMSVLLAAPSVRADPGRPVIEDPGGTPVTFTSSDVAMRVYVAHGDIRGTVLPDPYEKLPPLPYTVKLAPGTYTVEAESPNASTGHERVIVEHDSPLTVEVHSGNASVKAFGGVFIAIGIVSVILGIVSIASISPNDQNFNRWGVGIPLVAGGLGLGGLGIGMTVAGSTDIVAPHHAPGRAVTSPAGAGLALSWRF